MLFLGQAATGAIVDRSRAGFVVDRGGRLLHRRRRVGSMRSRGAVTRVAASSGADQSGGCRSSIASGRVSSGIVVGVVVGRRVSSIAGRRRSRGCGRGSSIAVAASIAARRSRGCGRRSIDRGFVRRGFVRGLRFDRSGCRSASIEGRRSWYDRVDRDASAGVASPGRVGSGRVAGNFVSRLPGAIWTIHVLKQEKKKCVSILDTTAERANLGMGMGHRNSMSLGSKG